MSNEEKADKISEKYGVSKLFPTENERIAYSSALQMAEWKDQQFENFLPELMICAQQGYVQCASDDVTIKEMSKILKGESNEK